MSNYVPPVDDMYFCINEMAGLKSVNNLPVFAHCSDVIVQAVLSEASKFFSGALAPLNRTGDV